MFRHAQFDGHAVFDSARFEDGDANFMYSKFSDHATFNSVTFNSNAWFVDAKFSTFLFFGDACFVKDSSFSVTNVNDDEMDLQIAIFENVKFKNLSSFLNRRFRNTSDFSECEFSQAPKFHGCTLHQDTTFPSVEYFKDTESVGAASAYRTLKLAMENARTRQEEVMFYALEQKSLRNRDDTPKLVRLTSYLYETFSDYGQSFGLPLYWLLLVSFLFSQFYGGLVGVPDTVCLKEMGSVGFAVQQMFRPFEIWKLPAAGVSCGLGIKLIGTIQSLSTISLFALFLLALRRRFKMD